MRFPDFIIIGAMKCATSTLHEQLALQPGFFMSTPKEPNFFSDDDVFARGTDWYRRLFQAAAPGDLCGESSTHYTKRPTHPQAIERMERWLPPHTRFIYIMRHPVDRLVSQYIHEWTERRISVPIDEAIDRHPELIDYSRYAMQVKPYLEAFGAGRVLPVFFESIRSAPQRELERIAAFLGCRSKVVWSESLPDQNRSVARLRRSPLRDALVNAPVLAALRRTLVPQSARDRIKKLWTMTERPQLSEGVIARLTSIFDADLAQLQPWCGITLTCASFREATEARHLSLEQAA